MAEYITYTIVHPFGEIKEKAIALDNIQAIAKSVATLFCCRVYVYFAREGVEHAYVMDRDGTSSKCPVLQAS